MRSDSRRCFLLRAFLHLCLSVALGFLLSWAENNQYLPRLLSTFFVYDSHFSSWIGPSLLLSFHIPFLFLFGLHRASYLYSSRLLLACYGVLQGVQLYPFFFAEQSVFFSMHTLGILIAVGLLCRILFQALCICVAGVSFSRAKESYASTPLCYVAAMLRVWGAFWIGQFLLCGLLNLR